MQSTDIPDFAPFWLIGGIPCHIDGTQPRPQPGESESYTLKFWPDDRLGVVTDHVADYLALRDRAKHANAVSMRTTLRNSVRWSIPVGVIDDTTDPLVTVEPGPYDAVGTPLWGLITKTDDGTTLSNEICMLTIDIAYIANLGEYADADAVRAVHKNQGFH